MFEGLSQILGRLQDAFRGRTLELRRRLQLLQTRLIFRLAFDQRLDFLEVRLTRLQKLERRVSTRIVGLLGQCFRLSLGRFGRLRVGFSFLPGVGEQALNFCELVQTEDRVQ